MSIQILCVDDEPRVLEGLQNLLLGEAEVSLATSGAAALEILAERPHPVVISDMRMPGMDGATFLAHVRERHPATVGMLLTGHSDLHDAAIAVNRAGIFRLLIKPCPPTDLLDAVRAAHRQFELQRAEKILLEKTLSGAIGVLTDVLGMVHPLAFGRATRIAAIVKHAVKVLGTPDGWQVELAAMLSQLGCITLDAALIEREQAATLSPEEAAQFRAHPAAARKLIERLPRLDQVALYIGHQLGCRELHSVPEQQVACELLQLSLILDQEMVRSSKYDEALTRVLAARSWSPQLEPALRHYHATAERRIARLPGRDLRVGMRLEANAVSPRGELWMLRGVELTAVAAQRLRALAERNMLVEPVLVALPT